MRTLAVFPAPLLLAACADQWLVPEGRPGTWEIPVDVDGSGPIDAGDASHRAESPFVRADCPAWTTLQPEPVEQLGLHGAGVVVADLDGDGSLDVLLPGPSTATLLRGSPKRAFEDASDRLPALDWTAAIGGSAADYDGDGDVDVLVTFDGARSRLLRNDGDVFADASDAAGVPEEPARTLAATWGDLDRDGDLDLFLANHGEAGAPQASRLLTNDGDGTFTDRSDLLPSAIQAGLPFAASWIDFDGDAFPELVTAHDTGGTPSQIAWNEGGLLVADDGTAGFGAPVAGMGLAAGDVNGDLTPDFLQSTMGAISLLESADGRWIEYAKSRGLVPAVDAERAQEVGWGADLGDVDHDGDLDAAIAFGAVDGLSTVARQPDALFLHDEGTYEDVAAAWSVDDEAAGRGLLLVDLDGDGWLDLLRRHADAPATLDWATPGDEGWLTIDLVQQGGNRRAVGARVELEVGGRTLVRWIEAGGRSMFSGGPPVAHFGLGDAEVVDGFAVVWPDGEVSWIEGPIVPRQRLTVERGVLR